MANTDNTEKTNLSPQGYYYTDTPVNTNPFWDADGESSVPVGAYVKTLKLNYDEETKMISLTYTDQDGDEHTLSPSWNQEGGSSGGTGEKGEKGDKGDAATVTVGTTTTTAPGTNASVTNSGTTSAAVLNFSIPRGATGAQGEKGETGATGATGAQGEKGDPGADGKAATVTVGSVETLPAGSEATVTNTGTDSAAILNFGIPEGARGATGATGETGAAGSDASVSIENTLTGTTLKHVVTSGETNYETDFPADYATDVTSKDTAISEATVTELENDLPSTYTSQLMTLNIATAIRADETSLTDGSHEIVLGVAHENPEDGSTDSYLYFLSKVYSSNNVIYAQYYRQSDNSYINVKIADLSNISGGSVNVTNEASGTDGVNKLTVGNTPAYILTEPKEITGIGTSSSTDTDTGTQTDLVYFKLSGTDQTGESATANVGVKVETGDDGIQHVSLYHDDTNEESEIFLHVDPDLWSMRNIDISSSSLNNRTYNEVTQSGQSFELPVGVYDNNQVFGFNYWLVTKQINPRFWDYIYCPDFSVEDICKSALNEANIAFSVYSMSGTLVAQYNDYEGVYITSPTSAIYQNNTLSPTEQNVDFDATLAINFSFEYNGITYIIDYQNFMPCYFTLNQDGTLNTFGCEFKMNYCVVVIVPGSSGDPLPFLLGGSINLSAATTDTYQCYGVMRGIY